MQFDLVKMIFYDSNMEVISSTTEKISERSLRQQSVTSTSPQFELTQHEFASSPQLDSTRKVTWATRFTVLLIDAVLVSSIAWLHLVIGILILQINLVAILQPELLHFLSVVTITYIYSAVLYLFITSKITKKSFGEWVVQQQIYWRTYKIF